MVSFRIIELKNGGFIPQIKLRGAWEGIEKKSAFFTNIGSEYDVWSGLEYQIRHCKVSTEHKAEKIIEGYYSWLYTKRQKEEFKIVKELQKPDF